MDPKIAEPDMNDNLVILTSQQEFHRINKKTSSLGKETNCDAHTEGPENHQWMCWSEGRGLMELLIALMVIRCAASKGQVRWVIGQSHLQTHKKPAKKPKPQNNTPDPDTFDLKQT